MYKRQAVDYLFYQTPWVMLLVVPVSVSFLRWKKKQMIRERKRRLNYQFRDALNSMSVAVQAGYSVENAVSACEMCIRDRFIVTRSYSTERFQFEKIVFY